MFPVIAQRSITAVLLESLLCNARMSLGMELLATQLFDADEFTNICDAVLGLDESVKHVNKDQPLSDHSLQARMAIVGVVRAKTLLQGRVDMILENASQINWVFPEVIKQANGVQEGIVVDLGAELNRLALVVDVALPDMVEHIVLFN